MPCCLPGGYVPPAKLAALELLRAAGVELPEGAQIWGPRNGLSWRVVDRYGREPAAGPLGSVHPLSTVQGAAPADLWIETHPERGRLIHLRREGLG